MLLAPGHFKSSDELRTPGAGPFLTLGAWLAGFIKRTTTHCYMQNMKVLGLVVSEKKIILCFSHHAPGASPVWTCMDFTKRGISGLKHGDDSSGKHVRALNTPLNPTFI